MLLAILLKIAAALLACVSLLTLNSVYSGNNAILVTAPTSAVVLTLPPPIIIQIAWDLIVHPTAFYSSKPCVEPIYYVINRPLVGEFFSNVEIIDGMIFIEAVKGMVYCSFLVNIVLT